MSVDRGKRKTKLAKYISKPQHAAARHQWSQKQVRILYNVVYDRYIEQGKATSIDWTEVGQRVRVHSELCKARFYELQRELRSVSQPQRSLWTRSEIEKLVRGARLMEKEALRASRQLDWGRVAKGYGSGRLPEECKRVYDDYYYLCRTKIGLPGNTWKLAGALGVTGLICVFALGDSFASLFMEV